MFIRIIMMFLVNSSCSEATMKTPLKVSNNKPTNQMNALKWCPNNIDLIKLSFKLKQLFKKYEHVIKEDEELNFVILDLEKASFIYNLPASDIISEFDTEEYMNFVCYIRFLKSKYAYKSTISELIKEINDAFENASKVKSADKLINNSGYDSEEDLYRW